MKIFDFYLIVFVYLYHYYLTYTFLNARISIN
jgi:hypothetical protein